MRYGAQSEHATLRTLLLHRPKPDDLRWITEENSTNFNIEPTIDPDQFVADYDKMVERFASQGVEIIFLTDVLKDHSEALRYISRRPNLTYMRDMASVYNAGAVVMNPFLKGRQWDGWVVAECFRKLGIPIAGEIAYPGYLEGGGNGFLSEKIGYVSVCDRANEDAIAQLASFVLGKSLEQLIVVNLPVGYVHIDGVFAVADQKTILAYRPALEIAPTRVMHSDGRIEYVWLLDYLEQLGFEVIDSPRHGEMNFVACVPWTVVGYDTIVTNSQMIRDRGGVFLDIPGSQLHLGHGGVHCMTCPVWRG